MPRAVAKRTFRRPGVNRSWEKADCRKRGRRLGYISLEELRWAELCWGAPEGHRRPQALGVHLLTRNERRSPPEEAPGQHP